MTTLDAAARKRLALDFLETLSTRDVDKILSKMTEAPSWAFFKQQFAGSEGVKQILKTLKAIQEQLRHPITVLGVLPTFGEQEADLLRQIDQTRKPIKAGMVTIQSGRFAVIGSASSKGALVEIEKFNAAGGLNGRPIELIVRDSKAKPEESARLAREFVNSDGCEILFDADTSAAAFAIQEVAKETGVLTVHMNSETSSLTADPKIHVPTAFRSAR